MNSPSIRFSSPLSKGPRSAAKNSFSEPGLQLSKIIGTTTTSPTGFDSLPSARTFAYVAGAAAVVAKVSECQVVEQRFFRGRPITQRDQPNCNEARSEVRRVGHARGQSFPGSPSLSVPDSPTGRSATAKDRIKAATSVALSPNGKWLALGETGYVPRILIFSLVDGGESPVTVLTEHMFGVHALRFSPDSKYLASLGVINDGFLFVWAIDDRSGSATLSCSNKCTTVINDMVWINKTILTVGLRFVKVWKPDEGDCRRQDSPRVRPDGPLGNSVLSPRHKVLNGKNCLLGDLIDANFVAALPVGNQAILCTESGSICLIDETRLTIVNEVDFDVSALRLEGDQVSVCGTQSIYIPLDELKTGITAVKEQKRVANQQDAIVATAGLGATAVEILSNGSLRLTSKWTSHQLPAHKGAINGVLPIDSNELPDAAFLTFSCDGGVCIWDKSGNIVSELSVLIETSPQTFDLVNELRSVALLTTNAVISCGDRYGAISLMNIETGRIFQQMRAHSAEITDMCAFQYGETHCLATCSRDRTVQLFAWTEGRIELLQTLDEHAGAVTGLLFLKDRLLSSSADRSIVIREAIPRDNNPLSLIFGKPRHLVLKSAPTSICAGEDGSVWVSSTDRTIARYSLKSISPSFSFKCADPDRGEAATMSNIFYTPSLNGIPTLVGISSSDKSVRLYTDYGGLLARDWGHTEGITGLAVLASGKVITVAADSTIFIWTTQAQSKPAGSDGEKDKSSLTPGPVIRKVISHSELNRAGALSDTFGRRGSRDLSPSAGVGASPKRTRNRVNMPISRTRTPSPPSPPNRIREAAAKENISFKLDNANPKKAKFGTLSASTESVSRTLRAYRKKVTSPAEVELDSLRELERELRLTLAIVEEKVGRSGAAYSMASSRGEESV
ncbi:WD40 repeat-like protein [Piedraia hortae CBS 480.64]|uniref:WD40 repeat-like protein n=1 Tax=Piedraia hortae CBS 480.64 TaxID=1314780 RepID=A0A6A7C027_9PEZI|nr:WD40 repeat-like protein [Piedraia hortae CBS 480.64]